MSLLYGPSIYMMTQYFNHRRPLATSVSSCGATLGGVLLPLCIRVFLDNFSLQVDNEY